ncbi:MAG: hypothetical protein D6725_13025 [Planctomycetota bacterium]|nr:MAG: hypothetical protein D6725_13025 [Planctomycetota bacterium]
MQRLLIVLLFGGALISSGCHSLTEGVSRLAYELRPYRLWRLNRQPPPSRDAYFCIPETAPVGPAGGDLSGKPSPPDREAD